MTTPDAVLHVGMQQSAATMLQRALSRLRPQLRAHGVAYLGHRRLNSLEHAGGWACSKAADPQRAAAFERDLAEAVTRERRSAAEVAGRTPDIVLLASDHLVGRENLGPCDAELFRPRAVPAVSQVIGAIGAERARLVLYTHRQDRLMEFCYLREIQKGRHHRFDAQFPYRFEPVLDYLDLVERLRAVPGVADVAVRPYETVYADPVAFVADFLGLLGPREGRDGWRLDLAGLDLSAPHRVYSRRGLKLALAMNPHLETEGERKLVSAFLMDGYAAPDEQASRFLPKAVRRRVLDAYREHNRLLFRTYLPEFPEDSYADNAATARLMAPAGPSRDGDATAGDRPRSALVTMPAALVDLGRRGRPVTRTDILSARPWARAGARASARASARVRRRGEAAVSALKDRLNDRLAHRLKETAAWCSCRNRVLYRLRVGYLARRCDAFLVSFPKCGRTWLRVMLGVALSDHAGIPLGNPLRFTTAAVRYPGVPRVLATHDDSPQMKPAGRVMRDKRGYRGRKVVLLVRDPRDVAVSLYFHVTRRRGRRYDGTLSDFLRDPTGSLASLLAFYDAWVAAMGRTCDVLVVRYEDVHRDPGGELRRVLAFLGAGPVSDATIARAVEQTSFDRLQRAEREGTAWTRALRTDTAHDPESYKVRRGVVGGYRDYLGENDVDYVARAVADSSGARHLGYHGGEGA